MKFPEHALIALAVLILCGSRYLAADDPPTDADLLVADSFENGKDAPEGWKEGAPVPGVRYVYDRGKGSDGKRSLSLQKATNRYFPIAAWSRVFDYKSDKKAIQVTAKVKAAKVTKAIIDIAFLDTSGRWIKHEWLSYIGQKENNDPVVTHDWKPYRGAVEIPAGTKQIEIGLQIYGPGNVWFDELEARYVDSVEAANVGDEPSSTSAAVPAEETVEIPDPIGLNLPHGEAQYLLIPPSAEAPKPAAGFPLLLVLPGGDGSAEFHPFIRRVAAQALGNRLVIAQPIAPPHIVWPTKGSTARQLTTEESINAIIADVAKRQAIDQRKVYALAWSSSGPAIYATLLQENSPLAGALIAMSVFKPYDLPPLKLAAGRRVYLLHSPEDAICPYAMAQRAQQQLTAAGVQVTLVDYRGGHGWHGPVYDNIRAGVEWLQSQSP